VFNPIERLGLGLARFALRLLRRLVRLGAFAAAMAALMMVLDLTLLGDKERE
jgi:hypothetical protein